VGDEKDIYCHHCYREEFANLSRSSRGRSRSRPLDSVSKMAVGLDSSFVEIVEINGNEAVDLHVDVVAQAMTETTAILADDGDKNKCPRCSGKVFEAEKMTSNRSVFHKKCFNCQDCHRALDPSLVNDGHEVKRVKTNVIF
jgi:hypothetical protein